MFLDYSRSECHLSDNTVAAYRRDLAKFAIWLGQRKIQDLNIRDLADYPAWLNARGLSAGERSAAPGIAQGFLSLPAIGSGAERKSGRVAGQPETMAARAECAFTRARRQAH